MASSSLAPAAPSFLDGMEEADLSSSDESDCAVRQTRPRRRPLDTSGMDPEEAEVAKKKKKDDKRAREKVARVKYRAKRTASAKEARVTGILERRLRPLNDVAAYRGGEQNYIQGEDEYNSKDEVMLKCAEVAEYLSLTLHFPCNSRVELKAEAEPFHALPGPAPFLVHADFSLNAGKWMVKTASFSGAHGIGPRNNNGTIDMEWGNGHSRTAFTDEQLASHAKGPIEANPQLDRDVLIATFQDFVRYPDFVRSDQWSRVHRLAYKKAYGAPDDNISMLSALVQEMEKRDQPFEYTTYDGITAVEVILSVRKSEAKRLREMAEKKPEVHRTAADEDDLLSWAVQRTKFIESHRVFLEEVNSPGVRYVDYMAFAFGFV